LARISLNQHVPPDETFNTVMQSSLPHWFRMPARIFFGSLAALVWLLMVSGASAQGLIKDNYYWYVPEHEKYSPTVFYGEARFDTRQIRIKSTQRFRLIDGRKGWFLLEFDIAGKVFIHQRLLRSLVYDPAAADPWAEFTRASVFDEEPKKIQARLQAIRSNPQAGVASDTKVPSWKRYKDSWGLKTGRASTLPATGESSETAIQEPAPVKSYERKARNKYPLLPPIGSEQTPAPAEPEVAPQPGSDPAAGAR
jgi:hypothetical protein